MYNPQPSVLSSLLLLSKQVNQIVSNTSFIDQILRNIFVTHDHQFFKAIKLHTFAKNVRVGACMKTWRLAVWGWMEKVIANHDLKTFTQIFGAKYLDINGLGPGGISWIILCMKYDFAEGMALLLEEGAKYPTAGSHFGIIDMQYAVFTSLPLGSCFFEFLENNLLYPQNFDLVYSCIVYHSMKCLQYLLVSKKDYLSESLKKRFPAIASTKPSTFQCSNYYVTYVTREFGPRGFEFTKNLIKASYEYTLFSLEVMRKFPSYDLLLFLVKQCGYVIEEQDKRILQAKLNILQKCQEENGVEKVLHSNTWWSPPYYILYPQETCSPPFGFCLHSSKKVLENLKKINILIAISC